MQIQTWWKWSKNSQSLIYSIVYVFEVYVYQARNISQNYLFTNKISKIVKKKQQMQDWLTDRLQCFV